jgi:hypothetical protein
MVQQELKDLQDLLLDLILKSFSITLVLLERRPI